MAYVETVMPLLQDTPYYTFQTTLSNKLFFVEFHWNYRDEGWYFSMWDAARAPVVLGVRLFITENLFYQYGRSNTPAGLLRVYSKSGSLEDPTFTSLGADVQIIHTVDTL